MTLFSYDWDFSIIIPYFPVIFKALLVTLELSILSIIFGTVLGIITGIFISKYVIFLTRFKKLILIFIDLFRALPILILLLIFNYYLSFLTNIKSPFWLSFMALSINLSAFIADILRASLDNVPKPLVEAGMVLGMDKPTIFKRIIFPEGVRNVIPSMGLLYIEVLKMSSIASVIGVDEITHIASQISTSTFRFLEIFACLGLIYIVLVLPFSYLVRELEKNKLFIKRS